ncbi:MAG TPA: aldehyde dehydrogenase (NADP(+)) [Sphingopyxis sp.]|nr:aldehyde dehydrogenase (NADP(+)) [Sphingopyxis sp.]
MIDGSILVGGATRRSEESFHAYDPATGAVVGPAFGIASAADVADACALAADAAGLFGSLHPAARADFLEAVAAAIIDIGDVLIETAMAETGLPRPRLEGERGRTTGQLQLFASVVRQGDWIDATLDSALPERAPPRPALRRMNWPLGPVAVFGASNFPLAFSVAGGDTASAFAAGCPVVIKGHSAHPGTGELVARAVQKAVADCGLPEGVFSYLPGKSHALGAALVADPRIKAVGFTGSRGGGLHLVEIARKRKEPIPVYAEMSSVNPVIILPGALADRGIELAGAFSSSLTLGAGQFCTNPGTIVAVDGPALDMFVGAAANALAGVEPATMLSAGIAAAYAEGVAALDRNPAVERASAERGAGHNRCSPALFDTTAEAYTKDASIGDEVFGSAAIVVRCRDLAEIGSVIAGMEGQLTATIQMDGSDMAAAQALAPLLVEKAGRLLVNGWPTGVEVTHAMVHGGPFPATSDNRSTSVGSLAIARFLRPVCFQDIPEEMLPPALQHDNPWQLSRRVDGERQAAA